MTTTNETTKQVALIQEMTGLAPKVAEVFAQTEEAGGRADRSEAQVLAVVIEMVKPALRAIASRPRLSERTVWVNGNTETSTTFSLAKWAGLRLEGSGAVDLNRRDNDGRTEGRDVFLTTAGEMLLVTYRGRWTRWQGSTSSWEAEVEPVCLEWYVANYGLTSALQAIVEALRKEAEGGRAEAGKAKVARAEKMEALLALLKK